MQQGLTVHTPFYQFVKGNERGEWEDRTIIGSSWSSECEQLTCLQCRWFHRKLWEEMYICSGNVSQLEPKDFTLTIAVTCFVLYKPIRWHRDKYSTSLDTHHVNRSIQLREMLPLTCQIPRDLLYHTTDCTGCSCYGSGPIPRCIKLVKNGCGD